MSVTTVNPIKCKYTIDEEGHQHYETIHNVKVDDTQESINDVSAATGLPLFGDTFSFANATNPDAYCNGKETTHLFLEGSNYWRQVVARFTTKDGTRPRSSNNVWTNPLNEIWKISGSFVNGTRVTSRDKDDRPIVTSGLETKWLDVPDSYDTLNLEGPSATISLPTRAQARNKVNSNAMWGLSARMIYLAQWRYEIRYHGNLAYVYHWLEMHINYDKWNEKWADQGTQEYIDTNPAGKRILPIVAKNDSLGNNVRFLDGQGRILPESQVIAGNIHMHETEVIPEFDFSSLGFPDPLPGPFV